MGNGNNAAMNSKQSISQVEKNVKSEAKAYTLQKGGTKSTSTTLTRSSVKEDAEGGVKPYHRGDRVLAKVSGYPWWPAQIVRYKLMNRDGITIEKSPEHFYKVQFFPNLDFSWVKQTGLKPLANEDISNFLNSIKRKSKILREAYEAAREPPDIEGEDSTEEEEQNENDYLASDTYVLDKRKRKSFEGSPTENSTDSSSLLSTMSSISSISEMYGNLSTSNFDSADSKLNRNVKKTDYKNNLSSSDLKDRRLLSPSNSATSEMKTLVQRLLYFRFKLQKLFLSSNINFGEEELYRAKEYLEEVEGFPYLNYEMITTTKIAKVLKRIALLDNLPKDELYSIRGQCKDILYNWKHNLSSSMESK
ncbi:PWWP domain protein Pdp1 [Schizosaccharomyces osmophilus]|uniref:PWWP domain protein Pdp1 n=1 Tax=Schizosaccharomyces osmophilus TaxID=2545709 RepID=A0AAE9W976_9SCHI|nr:PWWP domain protein Pdp1 [Schizosaccharomyces osmophilus]WBW71514.1 PWWP domain protein Pdp1 [Schizosaccharomyces osmophilus]